MFSWEIEAALRGSTDNISAIGAWQWICERFDGPY
jgi:hypothetical protein